MKRIISILIFIFFISSTFAMAPKVSWEKAINAAISRYGMRTEPDLKHHFDNANVAYPPNDIALLAFKKERIIELWAKNDGNTWHYIKKYPLTAFSGRLGPKLKEKDGQIPEGIYRLTNFNPFSSMHLSMMINYPNNFDRLQASKDGRKKLGDNIFLHGKSMSVGCLAVGNWAIDQLFLLTHRVGLNHVKMIISPNDLRISRPETMPFAQPRWLPELYHQIQQNLREFPIHKKIS